MTLSRAEELAGEYSPILVQTVNPIWYPADQIASPDFTGSLRNVSTNPQRLEQLDPEKVAPFRPKIYWSVVETSTHIFIIYAVYHIIDWYNRYDRLNLLGLVRARIESHSHDMEGALLVITKPSAGRVDAVLSLAHNNFYLYADPFRLHPDGTTAPAFSETRLRLVDREETIDGPILLDYTTGRVLLFIEPRGHGVFGNPLPLNIAGKKWMYVPQGIDVPKTDVAGVSVVIPYELEDLFRPGGLWEHRHDPNVFRQRKNGKWGFVFRDKKGKLHAGKANPPWSWDDRNDSSPIGEIAFDPARLILRYADGWGPVSTQYISNPYLTIDQNKNIRKKSG